VVLDEEGQPTSLTITGLFGAEVYSQNEMGADDVNPLLHAALALALVLVGTP